MSAVLVLEVLVLVVEVDCSVVKQLVLDQDSASLHVLFCWRAVGISAACKCFWNESRIRTINT